MDKVGINPYQQLVVSYYPYENQGNVRLESLYPLNLKLGSIILF